jgi:hypothetical protein
MCLHVRVTLTVFVTPQHKSISELLYVTLIQTTKIKSMRFRSLLNFHSSYFWQKEVVLNSGLPSAPDMYT